MQCQIKSMGDKDKPSDTLPKRGRVTEVCKEWLIHEDGALAYKLQKEEVEQHYSGNKQRNAQVREDFPRAKDEQLREEIEARLKYQQLISQQEEEDARLAKVLAERIRKEDDERRQRLAFQDEELARQVQKREKLKAIEKERYPFSYGSLHGSPSVHPDVNSVGLPIVDNQSNSTNYLVHTLQNSKTKNNHRLVEEESYQYQAVSNDYSSTVTDLDDLAQEDVENVLSDRDLEEEAIRRLQEQKDEELARLLQEQEEEANSPSLIDRDRLLAIEAQDKELARLLQDRERAKLKRARERAKQKALLKKQQQEMENGEIRVSDSASNLSVEAGAEKLSKMKISSSHPLEESSRNSCGKSRSLPKNQVTDLDAIEVMSSEPVTSFQPMQNIAMAIDPTYSPQKPNQKSNFQHPPLPEVISADVEEEDYDDEANISQAGAYLPIVQGQRRTASLEKKSKKNKNKEGCTQQ
ncbi:uncharacterized protein [Bemisia tabaci]|uniref:uncharacterized protein n=1 Tax=Bemisia tabaci TaxID=7038 RepID=UPI0008F99256|nr:PREDICTED: coiled-coil domain-containing protein 50 isoform X2 [Bemisia tabaci]